VHEKAYDTAESLLDKNLVAAMSSIPTADRYEILGAGIPSAAITAKIPRGTVQQFADSA
jgi:hypothetical protein